MNEDEDISKPVEYGIDTMEVSQMSPHKFTPLTPDLNIPTNTNNNLNKNEDKKDTDCSSDVEESSQSNTSFEKLNVKLEGDNSTEQLHQYI